MIDHGTIVGAFELPDTWPMIADCVFFEHQFEGGRLLVLARSDGSLELKLLSDTETGLYDIDQARTGILVSFFKARFTLSCVWENHRFKFVQINGIRASYAGKDYNFLHDIHLSGIETPKVATVDFSEVNVEALEKRKKRVLSRNVKPGRIEKSPDYLFDALEDEIQQVKDAIQGIHTGKHYLIPGLASRLRILLIDRPIGLLQHCAALRDAPLLVFLPGDPFAELTVPVDFMIAYTPHGKAVQACDIAVDVDVWLTAPALIVGGKTLSYFEVLKQIADTIGSHRDPDMTREIQSLLRRPSLGGDKYNDVARVCIFLAEIVIELYERFTELK